MRRLLGVVVLLAALAAVAPAHACACGIALQATATGERALVIDRPGREDIVLSLSLQAEGRPAIVLPVPGDPTVSAIAHGDPLAFLDMVTTPPAASGGGEGATATRGVDVTGRDEIGGYDVSRLRADDPKALDAWLRDNGYTLPGGAEPILASYVKRGWRYVAIRLAPNASGTIKPLRVSFPVAAPVYPMRLSRLADATDLTLYTLASGPRTVRGLDVTWRGPVSRLHPPSELRALFAEGRYVTKLTATGAHFTDDLAIRGGSPPSSGWTGAVAAVCALLGAGVLIRSRRGS